MALSPCLLVLALSVAHAGGDVAARRASIQVQGFERPAVEARATELDPTVEACEVESCVVSGAIRSTGQFRATTTCFAAEVTIRVEPTYEIICALPDRSAERRSIPFRPDWPPTELRWQAAPRRRWTTSAVPASSRPLFWLHERPPLTWPAPRDDRPRHVAFEPREPFLCGGMICVSGDVVIRLAAR